MNIAQPADLITEGVPEIQLETADQLQPGRIISGVGAQYAWIVIDRQAGDMDDWIRLCQLQRGVRSHSHQWITRGEGAKDCSACGLRLQRIADLLPVTTPRARVIIPPASVLNALDPYTVYATTTGVVVTAHRAVLAGPGKLLWSSALPIIPLLRPIWSLPEALRVVLRHASTEMPSPIDGIIDEDTDT
jgi:hypothetical protein